MLMRLTPERPIDRMAFAVAQLVLAGLVLVVDELRWYTLLGSLFLIVNAFRDMRSAKRARAQNRPGATRP